MNTNPEFLNRKIRRNLGIVGILCLSVLLPGADEGCVVEEKCTEGVLTFTITQTWETDGFTEANFSDTYTLSANDIADIADALDALDNVDEFGDPVIAGAKYRVLSSTGHDARRSGTVTVNGQTLLEFDVPTNATGTSGEAGPAPVGPGGSTLALNSAGVTPVVNALRAFVGGDATALNGFTFAAQWNSSPPPGDCDPPAPTCDRFTWVTEVIVQLPITFKFDGPA